MNLFKKTALVVIIAGFFSTSYAGGDVCNSNYKGKHIEACTACTEQNSINSQKELDQCVDGLVKQWKSADDDDKGIIATVYDAVSDTLTGKSSDKDDDDDSVVEEDSSDKVVETNSKKLPQQDSVVAEKKDSSEDDSKEKSSEVDTTDLATPPEDDALSEEKTVVDPAPNTDAVVKQKAADEEKEKQRLAKEAEQQRLVDEAKRKQQLALEKAAGINAAPQGIPLSGELMNRKWVQVGWMDIADTGTAYQLEGAFNFMCVPQCMTSVPPLGSVSVPVSGGFGFDTPQHKWRVQTFSDPTQMGAWIINVDANMVGPNTTLYFIHTKVNKDGSELRTVLGMEKPWTEMIIPRGLASRQNAFGVPVVLYLPQLSQLPGKVTVEVPLETLQQRQQPAPQASARGPQQTRAPEKSSNRLLDNIRAWHSNK